MIAGLRCAQIFDSPGVVTLWRLTDALEERLDVLWVGWLDDAANWRPFFERVARLKHTDVPAALKDFEIVTEDEIASGAKIKKAGEIATVGVLCGGFTNRHPADRWRRRQARAPHGISRCCGR